MIQSDESEKLSKVWFARAKNQRIECRKCWVAPLKERKKKQQILCFEIERITSHFFICLTIFGCGKMEVTKSSNKYKEREGDTEKTRHTAYKIKRSRRQNRRIEARKIDFASNVHCKLSVSITSVCLFLSFFFCNSKFDAYANKCNIKTKTMWDSTIRQSLTTRIRTLTAKNHRISLIYEYSIM